MAKRPLGLGKSHEKKNKKKKTGSEKKEAAKQSPTLETVSSSAAETTPEVGGSANVLQTLTSGSKNDELMLKFTADSNELAQLWISYIKKKVFQTGQDDEAEEEGAASGNNELVLNGIIHECDRVLRKVHNREANETEKSVEDNEALEITGQFYAIYGLGLAELAYFQTAGSDEDENPEDKEYDEEKELKQQKLKNEKIEQFYTEALDRIDTGLEKFPNDSVVLNLAKAQITANRIPLQYISTMSLQSHKKEYPNIAKLLQEVFEAYRDNSAQIKKSETNKDNTQLQIFYDFQRFSILDTLDDLLDMVENFGVNDDLSEIDSDNEEGVVGSNVDLAKTHPLYPLRKVSSDESENAGTTKVARYADTLIEFLEGFLQHLEALDTEQYKVNLDDKESIQKNKSNSLVILYLKVNEKLGELYLKKADDFGRNYTDLVYGSDDDEEDEGKDRDIALIKILQKESIALYKKAIKHLVKIEDPEDPETWVNIAEVEMSLGNIYDLNSEQQETLYKKAEKKLRKANKATSGKYEHILKNLLEG